MYTSSERTTESWWWQLRPRLTIAYLAVALALLIISGTGQLRLLAEIGQVQVFEISRIFLDHR